MGKVIILPETTKNPITLIGKRAGVCWNGNIRDDAKNYDRGMDCILSGHGRTLEFVNVEMVLDGYSARVIREWYTHIGGSPTRLQSSTRYVDASNFEYIVPRSLLKSQPAYTLYELAMENIRSAYAELEKLCIPREDAAMILPLGMATKVVDKRNLRNLVDMSHQRMCNRAYQEYRAMFNDICKALSEYSDEWKTVVDNFFEPKCKFYGKCTEKNKCGKKDK